MSAAAPPEICLKQLAAAKVMATISGATKSEARSLSSWDRTPNGQKPASWTSAMSKRVIEGYNEGHDGAGNIAIFNNDELHVGVDYGWI
ncbi:MAG: hypothetical protein M1827_002454 [Pycnora praestabilis]|nr:MAG: hypothetical protein M1827_002454 [Pycnora praestabilis]